MKFEAALATYAARCERPGPLGDVIMAPTVGPLAVLPTLEEDIPLGRCPTPAIGAWQPGEVMTLIGTLSLQLIPRSNECVNEIYAGPAEPLPDTMRWSDSPELINQESQPNRASYVSWISVVGGDLPPSRPA